MKLTETEQIAFDRIHSECNDITHEKRGEMWKNNVRLNRKYFMENNNPELDGIVIFIIGAGPSLTRNVSDLKLIPKNSRGYIMACDVSMPILYENNIVPQFCISIDGDDRVWNMMNAKGSIDTSKTMLLTTIASSPTVIKNWKGPIYFFMNKTASLELDAEIYATSRKHTANKDIKKGDEIFYEDVEIAFKGIKPELHPGGNVTASAIQFALYMNLAKKIVIAGLDLSWKEDSNFYADGINKEMGYERTKYEATDKHIDIYGDMVITNMSFFNFKAIHEDLAKVHTGKIINSTEGGILGIERDGTRDENIEFLTLEESIKKYVL